MNTQTTTDDKFQVLTSDSDEENEISSNSTEKDEYIPIEEGFFQENEFIRAVAKTYLNFLQHPLKTQFIPNMYLIIHNMNRK